MENHSKVNFENSYNSLPETFFKRVKPEKMPDVGLFLLNQKLSDILDFDYAWLKKKDGIQFLSGQNLIKGSEPIALAYAGHQFGSFVPQLGDGRAILLGEVKDKNGYLKDIHLKGSGKTPFSRSGDGRATLGPVLREYIISEYMNSINIPTTRSLAAITTGEKVVRERLLPGAILVRISNSHVRVGTFQYFAARKMTKEIKILADYIIERHLKLSLSSKNIYEEFLMEIIKLQANLISKWMSAGFIHGETIDYGPCAFMDIFDYNKVFSSIDYQGRYSYKNQPNIILWNLTRFAETILPLIDNNLNKSIKKAEEILNEFASIYESNWISIMGYKLGIHDASKTDKYLIEEFLTLMQNQQLDFTNSFYSLSFLIEKDQIENKRLKIQSNNGGGRSPNSSFNNNIMKLNDVETETQEDQIEKEGPPKSHKIYSKIKSSDWYAKWTKRLNINKKNLKKILKTLLINNPSIIPRNHIVEKVLNDAINENKKDSLNEFLNALNDPYKLRTFDDPYTKPPSPNEEVTQTFCGT